MGTVSYDRRDRRASACIRVFELIIGDGLDWEKEWVQVERRRTSLSLDGQENEGEKLGWMWRSRCANGMCGTALVTRIDLNSSVLQKNTPTTTTTIKKSSCTLARF